MNPTIGRLLGLYEAEVEGKEEESKKLRQAVVLYLKPDQIGDDKGCHCGACMFFNSDREECFLTSPTACNRESGVCGLFLGGKSIFHDEGTPQKKITKEEAGYVEHAPTHCENCEYYLGEGKDGCKNVEGPIFAKGCCAGWESNDPEEEAEETGE